MPEKDLLSLGEPATFTDAETTPSEDNDAAERLAIELQAEIDADTDDGDPVAADVPPVADDRDASDPTKCTELPLLTGPVTWPDDPNGYYMVVWAQKRTDDVRPLYQEVGVFRASSKQVANARALEHDGHSPKPVDDRGDLARLLAAHAERTGVLLRAIPLGDWGDPEEWGLVRPAPILARHGHRS